MRLNKLFILCLTAGLIFSCKKDDDTPEPTPPRDRGEVAIEDDQALLDFLSTHFYNYEEFENPVESFDYVVRFDTISGANSDKTAIIDSENLITKTINYQGVDQQLYILKVREGEGAKPHFTDSTYVGYKGQLLDDTVFSNNIVAPQWLNLSGYEVYNEQLRKIVTKGSIIEGLQQGLREFRAASGYEIQPDNTIKWTNDYGIGAVFIPSGLGYFASPDPQSSIPLYSPLIFSIHMYRVNVADHDRDGIPSYMEDLDDDGDVFNDDTDEDGYSNHSDPDDDGDGRLTKDEIVVNEDGTITFTDSNSDGTPDYLDPDVFK